VGVRYDGQTGTISVRVVFFRALADPRQTSILHNATVDVGLGDTYGLDGYPDCSREHHGLYVVASLGDANPPTVTDDLFSVPLKVTASKVFSPDRTELDITVQDKRYLGNNLICWYADASNPAITDQSLTGVRLLDGFTPHDGDVRYLIENELRDEATFANNNLGHVKPQNAVFIRGRPFRCQAGTLVSCRGSVRLPSVVGTPTLSISGMQYFTTRRVAPGQYNLIWHHDEHARLSWRRCPSGAPKRLVGRPCHSRVHWTGAKPLWTLFA
jgi:hypothetical protein